MLKKSTLALLSLLAMSACSSPQPRIIQASTGNSDIHLTVGMATQIEMPDQGKVQSITVGNPDLLDAQQAGDVVNLLAKGKPGETNIIIRSRDDDSKVQVYQYHISVQAP